MNVLVKLGHPDILSNVGITYRLQVTIADTGLPGNPKNRVFPLGPLIVAKVVGFLKIKNVRQLYIHVCCFFPCFIMVLLWKLVIFKIPHTLFPINSTESVHSKK
jgi:hypothetical protein